LLRLLGQIDFVMAGAESAKDGRWNINKHVWRLTASHNPNLKKTGFRLTSLIDYQHHLNVQTTHQHNLSSRVNFQHSGIIMYLLLPHWLICHTMLFRVFPCSASLDEFFET
jgi:hypothetical protein